MNRKVIMGLIIIFGVIFWIGTLPNKSPKPRVVVPPTPTISISQFSDKEVIDAFEKGDKDYFKRIFYGGCIGNTDGSEKADKYCHCTSNYYVDNVSGETFLKDARAIQNNTGKLSPIFYQAIEHCK